MIRITICFLVVVILLLISLLMFPIAFIAGLFSKNGRIAVADCLIRFGFGVVRIIAGTTVTYIGLENIPKNEPVLYVSNHLGFFDVITTFPKLSKYTAIISKDVLKKVPILSWWMILDDNLFIDRKDIKSGLKTILSAIDLVKKKGESVLIYPEGTRSKDKEVHEFKEGSMKVATKTGCKIVPIAVTGTDDVFENQFPKLRKKNVTVQFGVPIDTAALSKDEMKFIGRQCKDMIVEMKKAHVG